jgi:hypothetical protein
VIRICVWLFLARQHGAEHTDSCCHHHVCNLWDAETILGPYLAVSLEKSKMPTGSQLMLPTLPLGRVTIHLIQVNPFSGSTQRAVRSHYHQAHMSSVQPVFLLAKEDCVFTYLASLWCQLRHGWFQRRLMSSSTKIATVTRTQVS